MRRNTYKFCVPMEKHYLTKIASNAAMALSMAKELSVVSRADHGEIQEFAHLIDAASKSLMRICKSHAFDLDEEIYLSKFTQDAPPSPPPA